MFHVVFCILLIVVYMSAVADQLPRLGKRELICLLSFICNYVVSDWRGFLFLVAWDRLCYFIVTLPEPSIIVTDLGRNPEDSFCRESASRTVCDCTCPWNFLLTSLFQIIQMKSLSLSEIMRSSPESF